MIFNIKNNLTYKARLVGGGHVTNANGFDTYASTVHTENVRLIMYLIVKFWLSTLIGDVSTAYLNAFTKEKIWSRAGPEFGELAGCIVIIRKALYGLKSSARAWYFALCDVLRDMGFTKSRIDGSFWYKL